MSSNSRQKSLSRNSETSRRFDYSSRNGSLSSIEPASVSEFRKMKQAVHALFELAKNELGSIYQYVASWSNEMYARVASMPRNGQNYQDYFVEVRRQAESAMAELQDKLISALVVPSLVKKIKKGLESQHNHYGLSVNKAQKEKRTTAYSSSKTISSTDIDAPLDKLRAKRITTNHMKKYEDLTFLEDNWPLLETIQIESRQIENLCSMQNLKAERVQIINLNNNQIGELGNLAGARLPALTQLQLCGNKLRRLDGIEQASMPKLTILRVAGNNIKYLDSLARCQFNELLELNLEGNQLESVAELNNCNFPNLQILNLDRNRLRNIQSLGQCTFYRLKLLSFAHNSVTSLEFLARISLRRLEAIIGSHNKIVSIDPLALASLPQVKEIVLNNNLIADLTCVKRMKVPELMGFDLQYNNLELKTVGCFVSNDRGIKDAKKRFPFILL